jgi:hypothetical protein
MIADTTIRYNERNKQWKVYTIYQGKKIPLYSWNTPKEAEYVFAVTYAYLEDRPFPTTNLLSPEKQQQIQSVVRATLEPHRS